MMLTAAIQPRTSCSIIGGVGLKDTSTLETICTFVHNVLVIVGNHRMKTYAIGSP